MVFLPSVLFPDNHVGKKRRAVRKVGPPLVGFLLFAFSAAAGAFAGSTPAAAAGTTFSRARAAAGDAGIRTAASAVAALATT
jgi:hypothetical protein